VIRSTSARWRSDGAQRVEARVLQRGDRLVPWLATWRSRRGCVSQRRSARLPMPVAQPSIVDSSVGASWPRSVRVSSRLRVRRRRQVDQLAAPLHRQPLHVGEGAALRVLGVAEQGRRAAWAQGEALGGEAGERGDAQLREQLSRCRARRRTAHSGRRVIVVAPASQAPSGRSAATRTSAGARRAIQPASSSPLHSERPISPFDSAVQARPKRCRVPLATASSKASLRSASRSLSVSVPGVTMRTTLRSTGPLAAPTSPDLLADRDRFAELDELGEVAFDRVHGHAAHRNRLAVARAARRKGDVEEARGLLRVVEEELVEVAHPVEEERLGMGGLDAQVLGHHRRRADRCGFLHRPARPGRAYGAAGAPSRAGATLVCGASICTSWP
jgi:hypothetical protein